jgi:hypothetical protein
MNKKWDDEIKQLIFRFAPLIKDRDMPAKILAESGQPISLAAYRKLRQRLGIKK